MSSTTDKMKGNLNEAAGKAKQGLGEATDNEASARKSKAKYSRSKVM